MDVLSALASACRDVVADAAQVAGWGIAHALRRVADKLDPPLDPVQAITAGETP